MGKAMNTEPAVCWLKVTDYLHDWVRHELCGSLTIHDQPIVCLQHLEGVRDIMRMEVTEDIELNIETAKNTLSAQRYRIIKAGLEINEEATTRMYGIGKAHLALYMPVECPAVCLTADGVLRSWTGDVCFSHQQSVMLQRLLRDMFFDTLTDYDRQYAGNRQHRPYPAIDMIETFCEEMGINDTYADVIRREWQRRRKKLKVED